MNAYPLGPSAEAVDIALILEGSYPYMLGGVSAWVHQIIQNFPEYTFGLVFLGGSEEDNKEGIRYAIPDNVIQFQTHYLFEEKEPAIKKNVIGNPGGFLFVKEMHEQFKCPHAMEQIGDISLITDKEHGVDYEQFLYSKLSWEYITEEYSKQCGDTSFIDYYWTVRNIHKPLWKLASIVDNFPQAKVVHTVSTGYAGLLSFLVQRRYNYPVILTEHGIYTKERKIDIFLSNIFRDDNERALAEASYLRNLWDRYFKTLAQLSYQVADPIVSLFKHAQSIQLEEGANPDKTIVIPNGIDIQRYQKARRPLDEKQHVICFVGRIVPIKDVKGFIKSIPYLHNADPSLKFWIVGSTDQDPAYAKECVELVENIQLEDIVEFKPHQKMDDILPQIKILVLSALREGMPLVILESFAAGVPVVVTDVGACKELILGVGKEDKALGPAGTVVKVADPHELQQAITEIIASPKLWKQMSKTAIKRAERYYSEKTMIDRYRVLYEGAIKSWLE